MAEPTYGDKITQARHQKILDVFSTGPQTIDSVTATTGIPYHTVRRDIQETLINEGFVKREGYRIGRSDAYSLLSEYVMPRIQDVDLEDFLFRLINGFEMSNAVAGTMAKFDIVLKTYEIAYLEWSIREYGDLGNVQQERIDELKSERAFIIFQAKQYYTNQIKSIQAFEENRMLPMPGLWRNLFNSTTRIPDPESAKNLIYALKERVKDWKLAAVRFPIPSQEDNPDESSDSDNHATAGEVLDSVG